MYYVKEEQNLPFPENIICILSKEFMYVQVVGTIYFPQKPNFIHLVDGLPFTVL